ncbi:PaaI family thioesterase [Zhongshania guokunii]|uniref:PaaI family thioesterase n=1 Tax=Zhongshania guokunii TaxID=641783 RepID=A0ABV3U630_9GAMM
MSIKQQISEFLATEFPQSPCLIDDIGPQSAVVRYQVDQRALRPGGTVSGPVLMTTADLGLYAAILGEIGIVPLAVTTNLNINFLRKPSASSDIIGVCKLIKIGRLLIIGEVSLYSEGDDRPVAHAVGTYAIPPQQN